MIEIFQHYYPRPQFVYCLLLFSWIVCWVGVNWLNWASRSPFASRDAAAAFVGGAAFSGVVIWALGSPAMRPMLSRSLDEFGRSGLLPAVAMLALGTSLRLRHMHLPKRIVWEFLASHLVLCNLAPPFGFTLWKGALQLALIGRLHIFAALGVLALRDSKLGLAERHFQTALALLPDPFAKMWLLARLAAIARRRGNLSLAIPLMHKVTERQPWMYDKRRGAAMSLEYAVCLVESGADRRAGQVLSMLYEAKRLPEDFYSLILVQFGKLAMQSRNLAMVDVYFEEAVQKASSPTVKRRVLLEWAQGLLICGAVEKARETLARNGRLAGEKLSPLARFYDDLIAACGEGQEAAILRLQRVEAGGVGEENAERGRIAFMMAWLYDRRGDDAKCAAACRKVLQFYDESWFGAEAKRLLNRRRDGDAPEPMGG